MSRGFQHAMERLIRGIRLALGVLLIAMVALNVGNAAGRYLFQRAIVGADEILVFAMVWLVFLGAAVVTWEGRHLRLDLIGPLLPPRLGRALALAHLLVLAGLAGFVAVQSAAFVARLAQIGQVSMGAQVPMTLPHAAIGVGFGLASLLAVLRVLVLLRKGPAPGKDAPRDGDAA